MVNPCNESNGKRGMLRTNSNTMGRRKRNKRRHMNTPVVKETLLTLDEQEQICKKWALENGWIIPGQLGNWKKYFCNKQSYLDAFVGWLKAKKHTNGWVKIEDDVDRRKMKVNYAAYREVEDPSDYQDGDDYWMGEMGLGAQTQTSGSGWSGGNSWKPSGPAIPFIPAPSGRSLPEGQEHACF